MPKSLVFLLAGLIVGGWLVMWVTLVTDGKCLYQATQELTSPLPRAFECSRWKLRDGCSIEGERAADLIIRCNAAVWEADEDASE
jgi:hypothetical protein